MDHNGYNWLEELWLKRRAQFSTVAFIKSSDPKRLPQLIKFINTIYSSSREKKPFKIFLYKVWSGLYEVSVKDNITYTPVVATTQNPFLPQQQTQLRDLQSTLDYMEQLMMSNERIIVIFYGLFSYKSVSDSEYYNFIKFLRNAIFSSEYYVKYHFIIIFTSDPHGIADDDTIKHSIVVDVPPSTLEERISILRDIAKQLGIDVNDKEISVIAESMRGLNLHEVESVALESVFRYSTFKLDAMIMYKHDIIRKSGLLDIEEPTHGFEAIGGYDVIKEFIRSNVINVLRNPERARKLGIEPPRGLLLFGAPGTGKTLFARALAKELGLPFLRMKTEKIVSMWYGETSRNLAKALEISESIAPCVLFVDEIDRFGKRGGITEHEESRRAFSILLEWLGDVRRKTIVIGTTNRVEDLDEAFRRVGRFDYMIPMLYPDRDARLEILKVHTMIVRKVPLAKDVDLSIVADSTELWSGAELEELVKRACRIALNNNADAVTMNHFEEALRTFKISMRERREQMERYLRLAEEFCNDSIFLESLMKQYKDVSRLEAVKRF